MAKGKENKHNSAKACMDAGGAWLTYDGKSRCRFENEGLDKKKPKQEMPNLKVKF